MLPRGAITRLVLALVLAGVINAGITVALATFVVNRVPANTESIVYACERLNEQSAKQKQMWEKLDELAGASVANRTTAEEARREEVRARMNALREDLHTPLDCSIPIQPDHQRKEQ